MVSFVERANGHRVRLARPCLDSRFPRCEGRVTVTTEKWYGPTAHEAIGKVLHASSGHVVALATKFWSWEGG